MSSKLTSAAAVAIEGLESVSEEAALGKRSHVEGV
jgi:hypothetical protein